MKMLRVVWQQPGEPNTRTYVGEASAYTGAAGVAARIGVDMKDVEFVDRVLVSDQEGKIVLAGELRQSVKDDSAKAETDKAEPRKDD